MGGAIGRAWLGREGKANWGGATVPMFWARAWKQEISGRVSVHQCCAFEAGKAAVEGTKESGSSRLRNGFHWFEEAGLS